MSALPNISALAARLVRIGPASTLPGMKTVSQILLTALFALAISVLTFAASFAEAPRSEYLPSVATHE